MQHSFKDRFVSGVLSFVIAVVFVLSTAIPDIFNAQQTVNAATLLEFDSATQVNYSTVLGRAVDFGIASLAVDTAVTAHVNIGAASRGAAV